MTSLYTECMWNLICDSMVLRCLSGLALPSRCSDGNIRVWRGMSSANGECSHQHSRGHYSIPTRLGLCFLLSLLLSL